MSFHSHLFLIVKFFLQDEIQEYYSNYLVKAVQRHPLDQSSYEVLSKSPRFILSNVRSLHL